MTVYFIGLGVVLGLISLALYLAKSSGYKESELDATIARVDAIQKAAEEAKQNEKTVANLSRDELRKRLSE